MASLDFLDKEPTELSHEEWQQFVAVLRSNQETEFLSDDAAFADISAQTMNFSNNEQMTLKVRFHLGVPTVHTKPRRGRGACTGSAKEGTYEGTFSHGDSVNQTRFIYLKKEGTAVVGQFRTALQKIVGTFKSEVGPTVADGLNLKGAFNFA
ncbi:hypothetical protein VPNG_08018 [Cytospora leucostoma]|uniref:Uncharacterized protein n=1 Tax=Cytospora leucostoma TaxID=1230097 RepID=A0A423WR47_9PEZI|nr:hypothetical protein VPNG_08018 [Cytospora leucostoma]